MTMQLRDCLQVFFDVSEESILTSLSNDVEVLKVISKVKQDDFHTCFTNRTRRVLMMASGMFRQDWKLFYNLLVLIHGKGRYYEDVKVRKYFCSCSKCSVVKEIYLSYEHGIPHIEGSPSSGGLSIGHWSARYCTTKVAPQFWMLEHFDNVVCDRMGYSRVDMLKPKNNFIEGLSKDCGLDVAAAKTLISGSFILSKVCKEYSFRRVTTFILAYNKLVTFSKYPKIRRKLTYNKNMLNKAERLFDKYKNFFDYDVDVQELRNDLFYLADTGESLVVDHGATEEEFEDWRRKGRFSTDVIKSIFKQEYAAAKEAYEPAQDKVIEELSDKTVEYVNKKGEQKVMKMYVCRRGEWYKYIDMMAGPQSKYEEVDENVKMNIFSVTKNEPLPGKPYNKVKVQYNLEEPGRVAIRNYKEALKETHSAPAPKRKKKTFAEAKVVRPLKTLLPAGQKMTEEVIPITKVTNLVDTKRLYFCLRKELYQSAVKFIEDRNWAIHIDYETFKIDEGRFAIGYATGSRKQTLLEHMKRLMDSEPFFQHVMDVYNREEKREPKDVSQRLIKYFYKQILHTHNRKKRAELLCLNEEQAEKITALVLLRSNKYVEYCKENNIKGGMSRTILRTICPKRHNRS